MEGLRKTTKNLGQHSLYPGRDLNPRPAEYDAEVLTTQPRRSVFYWNLIILLITRPTVFETKQIVMRFMLIYAPTG
jgi:hypothetical protein